MRHQWQEEWMPGGSTPIGWWVTGANPRTESSRNGASLPITAPGTGNRCAVSDNITFPLFVTGENLWFNRADIQPRFFSEKPEMPDAILRTVQTLTLNGVTYNWEQLQQAYTENRLPEGRMTKDLIVFLQEWMNPASVLDIQTSGSTGTPTRMKVKKTQVLNSARFTCDYFNLKQGDSCLLCLPLEFIAAKMMVIRALVRGLNLWLKEPDGHPFEGPVRDYAFVPLVPLQVFNTLQTEREKEALSHCQTLLIGGGPLSSTLESALSDCPVSIFASYGMAETLSHIALRRVNGTDASAYYTPFPGVSLFLSVDGCLIIDAPLVTDATITTGDRVELLPDGRFRVLGRKDNLILTGGMKVQAEELESKISQVMTSAYAITSAPDTKFGECIVLIAEAPWLDICARSCPPGGHPNVVASDAPYHQRKKLSECTEAIGSNILNKSHLAYLMKSV